MSPFFGVNPQWRQPLVCRLLFSSIEFAVLIGPIGEPEI